MSDFSGEAEQRQLGANGVDVIDELCEASIFDEAAKYLSNAKKLKLSNEQKLTFYSLFKQATVGPCNTAKPSILSMYERTKWNAWNDLGKMSKDEAIMRYVNELEKVAPSWAEENAKAVAVASDDDDDGKGGNGSGGAMVMPQSRPVDAGEVAISDLTEKDKTVWFWAEQNRLDEIRKWLQKENKSINVQDSEGRSALHWAVDRGHESLVQALITELKADVNLQDQDGSTPLHYAVLCEQIPVIETLLRAKADPDIADGEGETPREGIEAMKDLPQAITDLLSSIKSKSN